MCNSPILPINLSCGSLKNLDILTVDDLVKPAYFHRSNLYSPHTSLFLGVCDVIFNEKAIQLLSSTIRTGLILDFSRLSSKTTSAHQTSHGNGLIVFIVPLLRQNISTSLFINIADYIIFAYRW